MKNRFVCLLLVLALCASLLSVSVLAAESEEDAQTQLAEASGEAASEEASSAEDTVLLALPSDGDADANAMTVGVAQEVSDGGSYTIELTSGVCYYVTATGLDSIELSETQSEGDTSPAPPAQSIQNGSMIQRNKTEDTVTCTIVCTGSGSITVQKAADANITALKCNTSMAAGTYCFTAASSGSYSFEGSVTVYQDGRGQSTSGEYTLTAGETLYVVANGEFCLLSVSEMELLEFGKEYTIRAVSYWRLKGEENWYVLETSNCSADGRGLEGASSTLPFNGRFSDGDSSSDFYVTVTPVDSAQSGTFQLRLATDDDFTKVELEKTVSTTGAYSLTATEAGLYRISGSGFKASYYDEEEQSWQQKEANDGEVYLSLTAGQTVRISLSDGGSFEIEKTDIPELTLGQTVTLTSADAVTYQFTASEENTYCFYVSGDVTLTCPTENGLYAYGWQDSSPYCFVYLKQGRTMVVEMQGTADASVTFNTQAAMSETLTLNTDYTTSTDSRILRYTPETSGLYIISASFDNDSVCVRKDGLTLTAGETISSGGTVRAAYLTDAEDYIFTMQANAKLKVQTPAQYGSKDIELGESETATVGSYTLYRFVAEETGLYTITAEGQTVTLYDGALTQIITGSAQGGGVDTPPEDTGDGDGNGGDEPVTPPDDNGGEDIMPPPDDNGGGNGDGGSSNSYTTAVTAGETIYLFVQATAEDNSIKITAAELDGATQLKLDETVTRAQGLYCFEAPKDGVYVLTTDGVKASALVDGSGNQPAVARSGSALLQLEKGQKAYVTVTTDTTGDQAKRSVVVTELSDTVKDVTLRENYYCKETGGIYRITAPEDGFYVVKVTNGWTGSHYIYSTEMEMNELYFGADFRFINGYVEPMEKGECLYVIPADLTTLKGAWIWVDYIPSSADAQSALEKLEEINGIPVGLTNAELRTATQWISANTALKAALEDSAVVETFKALDDAVDDAAVEVTDNTEEDLDASVIGARLNDRIDESEDITLTLETPTEKKTLPATLSEDGAVYVDVSLENVKSEHDLAVPVCLTLKIPEGLDRSKLRLVHYKEDGSGETEILVPTLYQDGDAWYARFVVDGFSSFALAELKADEPQDPDDGGETDPTDKTDNTKKTDSVVKTGDDSHVWLWAALTLTGCAAGAAVVSTRKKEN